MWKKVCVCSRSYCGKNGRRSRNKNAESRSSPRKKGNRGDITYIEDSRGYGVVRREEKIQLTQGTGIQTRLDGSIPGDECWVELDGYRMRYLRRGSGPPLLLLHGLLGYSFSWRFTLPVLAEKATVYAVDMPGAGFSERPPKANGSFRAHAERLLRFLDNVGVDSCDLLGTSHGGAIAMMAAALAPERVRSLILVAPVNPWSSHGRRLAPFLSSVPISWLLLRCEPGLGIIHDTLLRRLYGDPRRIPPGTLAGYSAAFKIPGTLNYGLGVVRSWNRDLADLESALPRIVNIPTLLLWGTKDTAVSPTSANRLHQAFKDCQVENFDGVGHLPYEEVPKRFNSSVISFLSKHFS
jgi:pimeloyl-ACP methyl ester carboxylesterase